MKISNIVIENFRGITKGVYDFKDLTIFLASIGKGKSSVLDALIFALTGEVEVSDIRNGTSDASVKITFEDGSTVERIRDKSGTTVKVNDKRSTATAANEYITSITGSDVSFLPALMGIEYFKFISQRDLTDFFSKILPCSISFDKMVELIKEKRKLSDEEKDFLKAYFPNGDYGLEEIDSAYKKVFDERKESKAVLKNLLPKTEFDKVLPTESKEELETALANIHSGEEKKASYEKALVAYNNAVQQKKTANEKKDALTKQLERYDGITKPNPDDLSIAKEEKVKFQNAVEKSRNIKSTAEANIASFQKILDNLAGDRCVACRDIVCTTDKSCAKAELETRIEENKKIRDEHIVFIERCEKQIQMRDDAIEKYNNDLLKFKEKESLEKQRDAIVVPEVPEMPQAPTVDISKKAEINEKISLISQYELVKKAKDEVEKIQTKVALLEMAVSVLDVKTGVRTVILQRALSTFENLCNDKLAKIDADMNVSFKAENGIEVFVKTNNSNGYVPMQKASTGQFVLVAFALMCLIGKVTGAKYAIIDNIDKLDGENAKHFLELIASDNTFENVIVAGVNHADIVKACENYNVINM